MLSGHSDLIPGYKKRKGSEGKINPAYISEEVKDLSTPVELSDFPLFFLPAVRQQPYYRRLIVQESRL